MNADIKDTIWYNGKFYTQDKAYPSCSAVYCRNGVIMAMGSDEEILSLHPQGAASVSKHDLKGNYVMPGFVDSHMHLLEYAEHENLIHLEHAKSFDEVVGLCRKAVASAKENHKWVRAVGFNQDDWDEKILPTRKDLDRISTELPITIRRACLHVSVCNTKAMELMGLLDKQPEKDTENYDTYEDGSLNGIIREASQLLINDALPPLTKDEIKDLIVYGCEKAAEKGLLKSKQMTFTVFRMSTVRPSLRPTKNWPMPVNCRFAFMSNAILQTKRVWIFFSRKGTIQAKQPACSVSDR